MTKISTIQPLKKYSKVLYEKQKQNLPLFPGVCLHPRGGFSVPGPPEGQITAGQHLHLILYLSTTACLLHFCP